MPHLYDAILLIAACLERPQMEDLAGLAAELGLDVLTEVHNHRELEKTLRAGAEIIGINNRDLHTFKTDIATTETLLREIPSGRVVVSESGINTRADIKRLQGAGVHAFLIGEALMRGVRMPLGHKVSGWVAVNTQSVINADSTLDVDDLLDRVGTLLGTSGDALRLAAGETGERRPPAAGGTEPAHQTLRQHAEHAGGDQEGLNAHIH